MNTTSRRQVLPPDGPDLAWLIPTQRSRGDADKEPAMGAEPPSRAKPPYCPADEPDRWTPLDYVAGCSRVLDVVIEWYLRPDWCRPRLRRAVPSAFRGDWHRAKYGK